ncbi:MAG: hypothetical protein ACI97A_002074 [Planctomycetota bacterium]|jgi:hypothetical protein
MGVMSQKWEVKTIVCFSATAASFRFLELHPKKTDLPKSLFLAGKDELPRYDAAATAWSMVTVSAKGSKTIIYETSAHALELVAVRSGATEEATKWLVAELAVSPNLQARIHPIQSQVRSGDRHFRIQSRL